MLERTVRELQGQSCISLEDVAPAKQQIACTRSFGQRISAYQPLAEAVSTFASRAAEKLRGQDGVASQVLVFVHTSPFSEGKQYAKSATVRLQRPTADTRLLLKAAIKGLRSIYKPGYDFAKAGVMLMDIRPAGTVQGELDLFADGEERSGLMSAIDGINAKFGRTAIRVASTGAGDSRRDWQMRQELRTPHYTTRLADIPIARA